DKAVLYGPAKVLAIGVTHEHVDGLVPVGVLDIQVASNGTTAVTPLADLGGAGKVVFHHGHRATGLATNADGCTAGADATKISAGPKTVFGQQCHFAQTIVKGFNAIAHELARAGHVHATIGAGIGQCGCSRGKNTVPELAEEKLFPFFFLAHHVLCEGACYRAMTA